MRRTRAEWWRSESGHDGGWRLRLVAVANSGAADRSIGSDSARASAPGSLAGLPRFSNHADVHRCQRPAFWGRRRSGWAAAHSCANQCPGCGARPRLGFAARGRCGPSPSALQGRIHLGQHVSEHDVAPVTPICRSADGERQSLYFAHAMCTDRDLVAGVARAQLPYAANMVSGVDAAGCARGAGPGTAEAAARLTGMRCEGRGNFD
jgi:hypothetical protein